MNYFIQAIYTLYPQVVTTRGDIAYDVNDNVVEYDKNAVEERSKKLSCVATAKQLLQETDWASLPDVGLSNQSSFFEYRKTVRNYIINSTTDPIWPVQPTAQWSK